MILKNLILLILFSIFTFKVYSQYWIGGLYGFQSVKYNYTNENYLRDTFNVSEDLNQFVGLKFAYYTNDFMSINLDIIYENVGKKIKTKNAISPFPNPTFEYVSESVYQYLTFPIEIKVHINTSNEDLKLFVGLGPKFTYWLGGYGTISIEEFNEYGFNSLDYKIVFDEESSSFGNLYLKEPTRLQYSIIFGVGTEYTLPFVKERNHKIGFEARYNLGGSNHGYNGSPNFKWQTYYENFEFRNDALSFNVYYAFGITTKKYQARSYKTKQIDRKKTAIFNLKKRRKN